LHFLSQFGIHALDNAAGLAANPDLVQGSESSRKIDLALNRYSFDRSCLDGYDLATGSAWTTWSTRPTRPTRPTPCAALPALPGSGVLTCVLGGISAACGQNQDYEYVRRIGMNTF
jgi:hypothetical protein